MVTEKLIAAAMKQGKTPKEISDAINTAVFAKGEVAKIEKEITKLENEYRQNVSVLETKLKAVKAKCPHLTRTYHPDPSGNNDSYYECDSCGKTM